MTSQDQDPSLSSEPSSSALPSAAVPGGLPIEVSQVRLRPEVAALPAYVAGARAAAGATMHKLSSNENPYPPLPSVIAAIADAAADTNRYPQMAADDVVTALVASLTAEAGAAGPAVGNENVVVGNGSVAVLAHILQAVVGQGDEVVYPWRSFEAYPIVVQIAGGVSVRVPLLPDGSQDLPGAAAAITGRTKAVVVCTPNNPTGPAVTHTALEEFLDSVPPHVLVLVDEAYLEFVRGADAVRGLDLLAVHPNVVVLRTFSKAYGLAGLRVGYAVGAAEVMAGVRGCATPFGVSALAERAAIVSLSVRDELLARVELIVAERERVRDVLLGQGWQVPVTEANFVWLPLGAEAVRFAEMAKERGLLVRPFAGDGVRVSIGSRESNDAFLEFAEEYRRG